MSKLRLNFTYVVGFSVCRFVYSPKLIIFFHRLSPTINSGVIHDVMKCDTSN